MSSNTNIGNTPVNQGYVQLIHTGETGGIDGTLRTLYDGDGTASDLQIASNKVKISTELYIGSDTLQEYIQDTVGAMLVTNASHTNLSAAYDDAGDGAIDLTASGEVTLTGTQTLTNKTLTAPTLTGTTQGASITLSGDLTVNGTTTTVNQTNLDVSDNIIGLNRGASTNANDSGLIIERGSTGDNAAIIWDESADKFTLGTTTSTPSATGDLTISTGTLVATIEGNVTGNVTGSASLNLLKSNNLSDLASASTARSNLGVDAAGTDNSTNVTLAGSLDYITLSGQEITRNAINLTTDVTGTLPVGNGGTGLTSISTLLNSNVTPTSLGLVIGTNVLAQQTIGIANDNLVEIDDADAADNDYAKFTANGLEGRSYSEVRSDLGLGTLAQKSEIDDIDQIAAGVKLVAGESFVDSDANLMTAAAINDRIESFGYGTGNGDMTGVSITASDPLDISQSNTTSGNYSATISLDASEFGSYLTDMTDLVVGDTDELAVLDNGTLKRKQIDEIRLTAFDDTGFSSGISFNGSTANGVLTYGNSTTADVETDLVYTSTGLGIGTTSPATKIHLMSGDLFLTANSTSADSGQGIFWQSTTGGWNTGQALGAIYGKRVDASNGYLRFDTRSSGTTAERMRIDQSGNVGIGCTPNMKLNISHGDQDGLRFTAANTHETFIDFGDTDDNDAGSIRYDHNDNSLAFRVNASERARIDSSGNVGIGVNNPLRKMHVVGDFAVNEGTDQYYGIYMNGGESNDPRILIGDWHNSSGSIMWDSSENVLKIDSQHSTANRDIVFTGNDFATEYMRVNATGLGIGTNSPAEKLTIKAAGDTSQELIKFRNNSNTEILSLGIDGSGDGYLNFNSSPGVINTNAGDLKLDPAADVKIDGASLMIPATEKLYLDGGSDTYITEASPDLVDMYVGAEHALRIADFSNTPYVYVPDNAYLGAGSGIDFSIRHDGTHTYFVNNTGDMIFREQNAGSIQFTNISGTERLKIDSSGDVKITESLGIGVAASSTTGRLDCSNDVVAFSTSDKRLKENIKPLDSALDKVLQINGVSFDWKALTEEEKKTIHGNQGHDIGVIAQEVEEVLPEVVHTRDNGYKAVKYEKIVPLLIQAIKEQQKQIEELKNG